MESYWCPTGFVQMEELGGNPLVGKLLLIGVL
jgi:hypothetical protein